MTALTNREEALLRAAIALSARARAAGNEPYGALLAGPDGSVWLEAQNTQHSTRDCTAHAELNLVRAASARFERGALAGCTVYASGEPCAMCAGAMYWAGVGRVVFSLSAARMVVMAGEAADALRLSCAEVMASGQRPVEVLGPALEDEAFHAATAPSS